MKLSNIAFVLAFGAATCGCATIIQGTTQSVSVTTLPEEGAQCTLKNSEGTWYITSPGSTVVHKTKNDMTVECTKSGFAPGRSVALSHFGGTTAANVIAGGLVGVGVDAASGANYYYDSPISVTLGAPLQSGSTTGTPPHDPVETAGTDASNAFDVPPHVDPAFPNYQPPYPDVAQVNGEEGNVVLSVNVSARGKIRNVRVAQSSGFPDLDNAAIEGVMSWHFTPAIVDGDTASAWTNVKIVYRLPRAIIVPGAAPPPPAPQPSASTH